MRCLGVLSIVAAIIVPLLGYARLRSVVDWWSARPSVFIRSWALLATVLGLFLVYAAVSPG